MTRILLILTALVFSAAAAQAACFADYKAKQDDPLRLQYGVAEITGACTVDSARAELEQRLASNGWQLLTILGVFDDTGLAERRDSAGEFYLRY